MIPPVDLLRQLLAEADVIAEDDDGTAYLLLPAPRNLFDELCEYEAGEEALEDDDPDDEHDGGEPELGVF